jgi:hypothetical protein
MAMLKAARALSMSPLKTTKVTFSAIMIASLPDYLPTALGAYFCILRHRYLAGDTIAQGHTAMPAVR